MTEPIWCIECQDQPAVGRLGMIVRDTGQVVNTLTPVDMRVCRHCGQRGEGIEVDRNEVTGQVAVLKYYEGP